MNKINFPKFKVRTSTFYSRGFSLLELLIVVAIMGTLAAAGAGFYGGIVKNVEIQSAAKALSSDLRSVRAKSMIGQNDDTGLSVKWGARIVNTIGGGAQYYLLFSTPTTFADVNKSVMSTTTLPSGITFSNPSAGNSIDIIFSKISGTTTPAQSVTIVSGQGGTQTISVSTLGAIN